MGIIPDNLLLISMQALMTKFSIVRNKGKLGGRSGITIQVKLDLQFKGSVQDWLWLAG